MLYHIVLGLNSATQKWVTWTWTYLRLRPMMPELLLLPKPSAGGVSMDQILQACHWKSHNTFTSFCLKDLSGQNQKDLSYNLGSFVAAHQVMAPP